jgi:hypothetical protein
MLKGRMLMIQGGNAFEESKMGGLVSNDIVNVGAVVDGMEIRWGVIRCDAMRRKQMQVGGAERQLLLLFLGTLGGYWLLTLLVEPIFAGLAEGACPAGDDLLIVRVHELGIVSGSRLESAVTLSTHPFAVGTMGAVGRVVPGVYAVLAIAVLLVDLAGLAGVNESSAMTHVKKHTIM